MNYKKFEGIINGLEKKVILEYPYKIPEANKLHRRYYIPFVKSEVDGKEYRKRHKH
jgi:hypothetical protein